MSCLAPLYWTGTPIPQQLSVLAAGISLSPSQRIVFRQSFFLEGTQLFQGLCFGLRGGNHVLRVVEQQGWLFLWGLWLSASRILCVKGLGGTWKVKKSDHSLLVPFAFVRGEKKNHSMLVPVIAGSFQQRIFLEVSPSRWFQQAETWHLTRHSI